MTPITHLEVSHNKTDEQELLNQKYLKLAANLGPACGNPVFIWYKSEPGASPITKIQISSQDEMCAGLENAEYIKVNKSLTPKPVFLWYFRGSSEYDTPIIELQVSTDATDEASKMKLGLQRAGCNLSRTNGTWVYLWVKRKQQTYICDVTATNSFGSDKDLFQAGYIRIDETTNTLPCGKRSTNFLWYRQTTDAKRALTDLKISSNQEEYNQWQQQEYTPVGVNLNKGTGGNAVYQWYKNDKDNPPVITMVLLQTKAPTQPYQNAGANVIKDDINRGNNGPERFLCFLRKQ